MLAGCAHGDHGARHAARDPYAVDLREAMARRAAILGTSERFRKVAAQRKARIAKRTAARTMAARPAPADRGHVAARGPVVAPASPVAPIAVAPAPAPVAKAPADAVTMSTHQPTMAQINAAIARPVERPAGQSASIPKEIARAQTADGTQRLIDEGRAHMKAGRVLKARERFYAAMIGPARTQLSVVLPELARSYDPNYLRTIPRPDAAANPGMARALYQRALMLGVGSVDSDLDRLGGSEPSATGAR